MEQAKKSAAKSESERRRGFRFVDKASVVQPELRQAFAQPLEIVGIDGKQAAENDRQARLEPGQGLRRGPALLGDRVANAAIGDALDAGGDISDLARPKRIDLLELRREHADALDHVRRA